MWNGAVEAISTLSGATVTLCASRLHANLINTNLKVLSALCTVSICASASIFLTANAPSRFISYAGYLLFYIFYNFTITVSRYFSLIQQRISFFLTYLIHLHYFIFLLVRKLQKSFLKIATG